ncbi:MAG: hypothetical protein ACRC0L_03195 [Angustibacter sp.]
MGISEAAFDSTAGALADALEVKEGIADGRLRLGNLGGTNWQWRIFIGGQVRVRSMTRYGRRIECLKGAERFRIALTRAAPPAELSILNYHKKDFTLL